MFMTLYFLVAEAHFIIYIIAVSYIIPIADKKGVYNDLKLMIQKYFIQINIKINISIGCLFLDIVVPILHQAVLTNCYT